MQQAESFSNSPSQHEMNEHSQRDIQICTDFSKEIRKTAEKCRSWSAESSSSICKGGLATSAFVCDSLASSMESCMGLMGAKQGEAAAKTEEKKDCCH
jgi:hypothetical protein